MSGAVAKRVAKIDWQAIARDLDETGYALTGRLLSSADCAAVTGLYDRDDTFRSHVIMARHGSAGASTNTSPIRCHHWSMTSGPRSIRMWPRSQSMGSGPRHEAGLSGNAR